MFDRTRLSLPPAVALLASPLAGLTILLTLALAPAPAATQAARAAQARSVSGPASPGPVMQALMDDVEQVEQKLAALAEAFPADAYDWRPAEGVRSLSEVLMHVAADNYFIPAAAGVPAPEATGIRADSYESVQAYEARSVTPEEALQAMRESFRHLDEVMSGVDDASLTGTLHLFGQERSHAQLWVLTATHLHEHLGQLIAYARSNGVVPPWSQ